jgi:hypothetical protein
MFGLKVFSKTPKNCDHCQFWCRPKVDENNVNTRFGLCVAIHGDSGICKDDVAYLAANKNLAFEIPVNRLELDLRTTASFGCTLFREKGC